MSSAQRREGNSIANFTRIAIKNAFVAILKRKPVNQITVKDIVEECGINRNSFYYHFQDIPTLIDELITEQADNVISAYSPMDPIETCLTAAVDFAENNRDAILHVYNYMDRHVFEQYLWNVLEHIVASYVNSELSESPINEGDKEMIIRFYKCECFGLIIEWLNGGMAPCAFDELRRFSLIHKSMIAEYAEKSGY